MDCGAPPRDKTEKHKQCSAVASVLAAHSRVIFCVRKTLDYFFAGQAFSGYFLLFLALVQISKIVSARGVGGERLLWRFLLQ
jgi:hypothetical protein